MSITKKFSTTEKPNTKAIFRNLPGWKFDEGAWINPEETNKNFLLPLKSDLDLTNIPTTFFRSGIVAERDLELEEINFEDDRLVTGWTPAVRRGQYFSYSTPSTLHSSDSILKLADDQVNEDGQSIINLAESPHPSLPITAEYLERDPITFAVNSSDVFKKVVVFKGLSSNGRELDTTDDPANIDTSVLQFKVEKQESEVIQGLAILSDDLVEIENDIYQIDKVTGVVSWYNVLFSRPDIFKNELTFDTFLARQASPAANGDLEEGDYCIGYEGEWTENMPMRVYLPNLHVDYGAVTFKPTYDTQIIFNQNVLVPRSQTFSNLANDSTFYLSNFPILDLTSYTDGDLAGELQLDTSSLVLTVDAVEWTRVDDLDDELAGAQVFELDPLWGVLTFGDGGITKNGMAPDGEIVVEYTQVPLLQYDTLTNLELFSDSREDLDPQVNSLKRGFLVLDNRRLTPWKITLAANGPIEEHSDGSCCYGPLEVPAGDINDLLILRARVVARGVPEIGVPNVPVQFRSLDGLITFSQEFAITDGDGYAYTEAMGSGHFDEFIVSDWLYLPLESDVVNYLNPDPSDGDLQVEVPPWGAHLSAADTLVVGERFDGDVNDVYLLIQSIPADTQGDLLDYDGDAMPAEEYLEPYNGKTRKGGVTVVWYRTVAGAREIVHPISATPHAGNPAWTEFQFPIDIPTGELIVSYKVVIDRTASVVATTIEAPILTSNTVNICTMLNSEMKGQWKLPNLLNPDDDGFTENLPDVANTDSSRISTAVYMSPNNFRVDEIQPAGGGAPIADADVGDAIDIIGLQFPTTEELYVSVFIIKTDNNDEIIAVKNITEDVSFIDANTIRIASLPEPPTGEYDVNYWIAVGGFHPTSLDTGTRRTAVQLEIGEAP